MRGAARVALRTPCAPVVTRPSSSSPAGLGILAVRDVPAFQDKRDTLLPLAFKCVRAQHGALGAPLTW